MKKLILSLSIICLLVPSVVFGEEANVNQEEVSNTEIVTLSKCVDGDTAKFLSQDGTITTYRLLAVDTPETVHPTKGVEPFGKEASEFTCNALTNATEIKLEFDEKAGKTDKYNRGLAWVFVDGTLLQEQLVSKGLAEVAYLYGDYKYNTLLQDTEVLAKTSKLGVWSDDAKEVIKEEEKETTKKEEVKTDEKTEIQNIFLDFLDQLMDAITASLNKLVDSILQRIEDML